MKKSLYYFLSPKYQNLFLEYPVKFKPRYGWGANRTAHPKLYQIIDKNREQYAALLEEMADNRQALQHIKQHKNEPDPMQPTYNNGFLPGLDVMGIYTIIKHFQPASYVEVGSGFSTKVAAKSIKDNRLDTKIISIDPQPRTEIDKLAHKIIRTPFEKTDFSFLFSLKENDILFIDNSHRILPNSDSMVFFMEVLPDLPKGVVVHLHDIYLPYDYPQFMCDRFYSEQYGLAMYLLADSNKYCPIMPNFFISQDKELSSIIEPVWQHPNLEGVEHHGGAFWLQIQ